MAEAGIRLAPVPFDPWAELAALQSALAPAVGASAIFLGTARADAADPAEPDGPRLTALELEHYPGMTERELQRIATMAAAAHDLLAGRIVHRVGRVAPGEPIVLVAALATRRAAAFSACRQMIEALKYEAPFWKRECFSDGSARWVEANTPAAADGAAIPGADPAASTGLPG
ncbi:MAG: molybdenum cofactor biosynthesis protein MoaE [Pseudomonadota bacterium]|nr:molybdenum cofactor biosynthesis protein MoaE [Pseudomonadota bacterium]